MTSINGVGVRTDCAGIQALSSRGPGYAVAKKCLQVQADAEANDPSLKTPDGVRLHPDAWSWYAGALGEIEVGRMLAAVGTEWFVRHSIPIGAETTDVDHLVIGPGGVFAINTKHHRGASIWIGDHVLRVNNSNTAYLNIAQGEGIDVARRLERRTDFPITVTPVIAVLNARSILDRRAPDNRQVKVVDATRLVEWLLAQPAVLDEAHLGLIKLAAEKPGTWHIDPHAADTLRVMQRFERLAAEVGTPRAPTAATATSDYPAESRTSSRPTTRTSARSRTPTKPKLAVGDLFKFWLAIGVILAAIFIFRAYADQPCTTATACLAPTFYVALKPLLVFGGVITLSLGLFVTLRWVARNTHR
jgi:hypothetical protein